MQPRPDYGEDTYRGSARLAGVERPERRRRGDGTGGGGHGTHKHLHLLVAPPQLGAARSDGYRFSGRMLGSLDQAVADPGMPGRTENCVDYPVEAYQDVEAASLP